MGVRGGGKAGQGKGEEKEKWEKIIITIKFLSFT